MEPRIRIGAVKYLNAAPLVYRLEHLASGAEISYNLPSRLADDLARGELDVALIPSIEFLRNPTYTAVSDACIGCQGPVLSVRLFCRVPVPRLQTLALDEGSRTSAAMVRILLDQQFGIRPRLQVLPIGAGLEDATSDGVLLIGDRAIGADVRRFAEVWDLGDQWFRWAGLPFVFALWTTRGGVDLCGLEGALCEARDLGVAHLDQIARTAAAGAGMSETACRSYLCDNLNFYFGPRERRGLEFFYHQAVRLGLAPPNRELRVDDCDVAGAGRRRTAADPR
jgi:chorismate dehydratase